MNITEVWELCRDIYSLHGRVLSFPQGTDPAKTYQWRYLTVLTKRLQEWDLDRELSRRYIEIAVEYAVANRLLKKGLALFFQPNLQQLFHDQLRADMTGLGRTMGSLTDSGAWVRAHGGPSVLLKRPNALGYCNLVKWYQAGKVTELYLALSRTAGRAMKTMRPADRSVLPSSYRLCLLRTQFLTNQSNRESALVIMGGDLKNVGNAVFSTSSSQV